MKMNRIFKEPQVVLRMQDRVADTKKFTSPYAPNFQIFGARLQDNPKRLAQHPIYVAGKGRNQEDAMARLLGEAAERDTIFMQEGDTTCQLITPSGDSIAPISAKNVLLATGSDPIGSTGCATHNYMSVSIRSAIYELLERRLLLDWWTGHRKLTAIRYDRSSLKSYVQEMRKDAVEHRQTRFFLIETDDPIHCAIAVSSSVDDGQIAIGFAADISPRAALERAYEELLSVELETADLHYARLTNAAFERASNRGLVAARQVALESTHRHLLHSSRETDVPKGPAQELTLDEVTAAYADRGLSIELCDVTRYEIGLPTCRAFFTNPEQMPVFPENYELSPV